MNSLAVIVSAMGIAVGLNILCRRFDIPQIIGYILTGTIIVYGFDLQSAKDSHDLHHVAEFGIVFLMFMIGLEFSADKVESMKREVLMYGHTQMTLTTLIFFLFTHYALDIDLKTSIIIASAIALSSTAIVLKSFKDSGQLPAPTGKNVLGILIFQDIAVIPILLLITLLSASDMPVATLIIKTVVSAVFILFILFYPGKWLINRLLKLAADTQLDEIFVGTMLFIVIGTSMIVFETGFSYSLGAFIAGMIIAETRYKYQAEADLAHFRDLFLGLFFVTVGMQVDVSFLFEHFFHILLILAGIMVVKFIIIYRIIKLFQDTERGLRTGVALAQVGEFSFAIFEIARSNALLDPFIHQMMVLVVIFSMILTPFMLKKTALICNMFVKEKIPVFEELDNQGSEHVVVCGYGSFGQHVVKNLKESEIPYLAVDNDMSRVENGLKIGDNVIYGNVTQGSIMDKLKIENAASVIVAIDDIHKTRLICESILKRCQFSNIIVKVDNEEDIMEICDLDIHRIINEKIEIAKMLAEAASYCDLPYARETRVCNIKEY